MRSHQKFTAITSAAILALSLLAATTESAKAASYQVSTLSGQGGAGEFSHPRGISVAPSGEVFIADTDNYAIKKIETNTVTIKGTPIGAKMAICNTFTAKYKRAAEPMVLESKKNAEPVLYDQNPKRFSK